MRTGSWLVIPMVFAGCVAHEQIDLTGKECPCGGEFVCNESTNTCQRSTGGGPGPTDAGPRTDTGPRPDTGGGMTDAGPGVDAGMMMMMDMGTIVVEAESGALEAPMQLGMDAAAMGTASGGAYVEVDPASMSSTAMPPATGKVTFTFDVAEGEAGMYRVWGRVIAELDSSDSFWVQMDGDGMWHQWNNLQPRPAWAWDDVHHTDGAAMTDTLVEWNLVAGSHTLEIAYREVGAKLDKIVITNDAGLTAMDLDGL